MAVFSLESLVLRGVSVQGDGTALNPRLGSSVETTDSRTTEVVNSLPYVPASPIGAPAAGLFADEQESAWPMPAGRMLSTTARGTRGR